MRPEQVFPETGFSGATTAVIAAEARLPKANVHYYFRTEGRLYRQVLKRILDAWLASGDSIRADADPATAFRDYIAAKIDASSDNPSPPRSSPTRSCMARCSFPIISSDQVRRWVEGKARVIEGNGSRGGLMQPVDVPHLFFVIWSSTQTYADFDCQIRAVLKRERMKAED